MELNQTALRGILARVLSVDSKYIVPKQGNWWNPQDANANVANWCAYAIRRSTPRTVPLYHEETVSGQSANLAATERIATIDLQFVGPDSETLANSVAFWPLRSDVADEIRAVRGAIMNDGLEADSSPFWQEGDNAVTAWNVTFRVLFWQTMDTAQGAFPEVDFGGRVVK